MKWIIRNWSGLIYTFFLVILVGCSGPVIDSECQTVTIVAAVHSEEIGAPDWYTVVEFPDNTRRYRNNKWGEIGDTFCARKHERNSWR